MYDVVQVKLGTPVTGHTQSKRRCMHHAQFHFFLNCPAPRVGDGQAGGEGVTQPSNPPPPEAGAACGTVFGSFGTTWLSDATEPTFHLLRPLSALENNAQSQHVCFHIVSAPGNKHSNTGAGLDGGGQEAGCEGQAVQPCHSPQGAV